MLSNQNVVNCRYEIVELLSIKLTTASTIGVENIQMSTNKGRRLFLADSNIEYKASGTKLRVNWEGYLKGRR